MNRPPTTLLLVEDDPADARLIQEALADTGDSVESVTQLSALERLGRGAIDVVLLDLASLLEALKAMGAQLAIDDFGAGYSSPSYLLRSHRPQRPSRYFWRMQNTDEQKEACSGGQRA